MNLQYLSENALKNFDSKQNLPSVKEAAEDFEMEDTSFHVSFLFYFYAIVGIPPSGNFKKIDYCVKKNPCKQVHQISTQLCWNMDWKGLLHNVIK